MRIAFYTTGLVLLAAAVAAIWIRQQPAVPETALAAPTPLRHPPPSWPSAPPAPLMPATASAPASTLDAQIDRLIATRDPKDALAAYQLLADCASFNRDGDRLIFDAPPTAPW